MTFDYDEIFDFVDGITTVSVREINPDGGALISTDTGVECLRRQVMANEKRMGEGAAEVQEVRFHLRASTMNRVPKKRDRIVEADGTVWVINSVASAAFSSRYVCETAQYEG